ncbi:hypothetical protein LTR57_024643, partial [Friedmanniomyces endolithicus]
MPSYRSQAPPPGCQYNEDPYQGYAPHIIHPTTVALDHDQVTLERMSPQDAVPALYLSPKLSPAKAGELLRRDQEGFDQMEFPNLPELIDDTDCESPLALETLGTGKETPTATGAQA